MSTGIAIEIPAGNGACLKIADHDGATKADWQQLECPLLAYCRPMDYTIERLLTAGADAHNSMIGNSTSERLDCNRKPPPR